jgi:hypothetical protein
MLRGRACRRSSLELVFTVSIVIDSPRNALSGKSKPGAMALAHLARVTTPGTIDFLVLPCYKFRGPVVAFVRQTPSARLGDFNCAAVEGFW